ncbi:MAG TPA: ABC transporter permease [Methylomirabilota bacterium]|nr:ABC transporter permease [Methylomirabilota bacterium]
MRLIAHLKSAFTNLLGPNRAERELAEELRQHIQVRAEQLQASGVSAAEAERRARVEFGSTEKFKEECREERGGYWLETLRGDIRFGLRMLRKNPGFAAIAILTIGLGIGANTAVFSAMNTVLLRSLPLPHPEQLIHLILPNGQPSGAWNTGDSETSFSEPAFEELRKQQEVFSDLMAYVPLGEPKTAVRLDDEPEEAEVDMVSGNFFSGLGVRFARGRGFTMQDETDHTSVAVISYSYWTGRLARNPSAIGRTIYVKGAPFTVIGVSNDGFFGLEPGFSTDVWIPLQKRDDLNPWGNPASSHTLYGSPKWWCIKLIGRLQPGVTKAEALAKLDPVFQRAALIGLGTLNPKAPKPLLTLRDAKGIEGADSVYEQPIKILMVMVGLVLAIACGNVAMLLVARNAARQREFSLRMTLGAGRRRILAQLLTESLLLVAGGGLVGWLFAHLSSNALSSWWGMEVPFALDQNVLAFTALVSVACAVVFGITPLRSAMRPPSELGVKGANISASLERTSRWPGRLVIAGQMSLCLMLLVGAGLLIRSLHQYETLPLGLKPDGVLVFGTSPANAHTDEEKARFYVTLLDKMRAVPGVESATLAGNRPGSGWSNNDTFDIDGIKPEGSFEQVGMRANDVGPDFFHVLGIPILLGRDISDTDSRDHRRVAVVNETFAKRFFPKGDVLGHMVGGMKPENMSTIVGVAGDSKYTRVSEKPMPMVYFNYSTGGSISDMHVELHTTGDPKTLIPSVRAALHELDPNMPMQKPMTQRAQFDESYSEARLFARLAMFFGFVAILLVATGLYGTLAYRVSKRTPEIGVRMAMGAQRQQVLWMVLRESLLICAIAVITGLPLAFGGAQLMRSMLFGVMPGDWASFAMALAGITGVVLVSSLIPAQRAASVDPMVALRYE